MKKLGNIELVAKKIALPLIILAAGASSRWGKPKQLLPWRGQTLLERALQVGLESGASPLILVLGAWRQEIERVCPQLQREGAPWRLYFNPHWSQGMASSLRVGLEGALQLAPQAPGVLIHLADLPLVEAALVRRVAQAALSSPQPTKALAFPQYGGRRGHPGAGRRAALGRLRLCRRPVLPRPAALSRGAGEGGGAGAGAGPKCPG